jgi:uracil-DNA glycosylase family protein
LTIDRDGETSTTLMSIRSPEGYPGAEAFLPEQRDLATLRRAAESCRGCDLWEKSTQVVFGEGPEDAELVLVGEQPGDREDIEGHPFVGPAGRVLDEGLEAVGIDRSRVYLTNSVKHFRWEARGRRRLHKKPSRWEVVACTPWLTSELAALTPRVLVLMGATAAQSLLGAGFSVLKQRGRVPDGPAGLVTVATVHPSAILRVPREQRREQMAAFVDDLRLAADLAARSAPRRSARARSTGS